jgi:hypothetical protein
MIAYPLTTPQQAEVVTLKAAITAAQTTLTAANQALSTYLATAAGITPIPTQRLQTTADGAYAVVTP